jgi:uncharacterized protein YciI
MIFVVTNASGPAWVDSRPLRDQDGWSEHAAFMDALFDEGFVLFAGPLGGGDFHRALVIVDAESEEEVHARFAEDPWTTTPVLTTLAVEPWEVLLGDPARR